MAGELDYAGIGNRGSKVLRSILSGTSHFAMSLMPKASGKRVSRSVFGCDLIIRTVCAGFGRLRGEVECASFHFKVGFVGIYQIILTCLRHDAVNSTRTDIGGEWEVTAACVEWGGGILGEACW